MLDPMLQRRPPSKLANVALQRQLRSGDVAAKRRQNCLCYHRC
jgi:hypothetical protein